MGGENSHIANACYSELWIFFESRKLHLNEIILDASIQGGVNVGEQVEAYLNMGANIAVNLRPDNRIQFLRVPPRQVINIPMQGNIYVTAIAKRDGKNELMCFNFMIPSDRSIIVIDNGMVKMAMYGALWKDEEGKYH